MNLLYCVLLVVTCLLAIGQTTVVDVTVQDFDAFRANSTYFLVEFYVPWCAHCRRLESIWKQVGETLSDQMTVARVNGDNNEALLRRFKIRGYPHIMLFGEGTNGWSIDYSGTRMAETIEKWAISKTLPAFKNIQTAEDWQTLLQTNQPLAVGFFAEQRGEAFKNFVQSARSTDGLTFAVASRSVAALAGVESFPQVLVRNNQNSKFDKLQAKPSMRWWWWTPTFSLDDLRNAIIDSAFPVIDKFSADSFNRLMNRGNPVVFLVQNEKLSESETADELDVLIDKFALQYHRRISFLRASSNDLRASLFGSSGTKYPTLVGMPSTKRSSKLPEKFAWDESIELTEENIANWLSDIEKESVKSFRKSQPVPESNNGPVIQLVAKTFDSFVKNGKNVLVEYYAPWCGHCKTLEPIYEQLGAYFAGSNEIVIAKIDATENYTELQVGSFPTIVLHLKNGTQVSYEEADREFETLVNFVQRNTAARPVVSK